MDKTLSQKISYITFVCNIIIFLEHSNLNINYSGSLINIIILLFDKMSTPVMVWFFFITGYLYFLSYKKPTDFIAKIKSRVMTLLIPYIIWNIFGMILYWISGEFNGLTILQILRRSFIFFNGVGCADGPLWYIARLFTYFIFTPLIFRVFKKKDDIRFIIIEICLILINIYLKTNNYSFLYFLPFFLCGAYFSLHYPQILKKNDTSTLKTVILIICLVLFSFYVGLLDNSVLQYMYKVLAQIIFIMIIRTLKIFCEPSVFVLKSGMYIYCSHELVFRIVRYILFHINYFNSETLQVLHIIISSGIVLISYMLLVKYAPKLYNVLVGGRNDRKFRLNN